MPTQIKKSTALIYSISGNKKKKKTSNASGLSIASSGSGEFVQTSALSQPLIFQPHSRPNTSAHQVSIFSKHSMKVIKCLLFIQ